MGEPFEAIGFSVTDEMSYRALAQEARERGDLTRSRRKYGTVHGCCWQLGAGLEVWTMLYESGEGIFYADCRPAFRARQLCRFYPWEILEYEQDGEATLLGRMRDSGRHLICAIQNLTEVDLKKLPADHLTAAISGLAYRGRVLGRSRRSHGLEEAIGCRESAENDYQILGKIVFTRRLRNHHTTSDLCAIGVDLGDMQLEVVVNQKNLVGDPQPGRLLDATIWLQGHVLSERHLEARYEGVDSRIPRQHHWRKLRRSDRPGITQ